MKGKDLTAHGSIRRSLDTMRSNSCSVASTWSRLDAMGALPNWAGQVTTFNVFSRVARVGVVPLRETLVGEHRRSLGMLFGAVGCVRLVGCANVANLVLSRGIGRRRELLTRMALGATRTRMACQSIVEGLVLCGLVPLVGWRSLDWRTRSQTESPATKHLRHALVVSEVALAVVLVAAAGLLMRTLGKLQSVDVGFQTQQLLSVSMDVTTGP